MRVTYANELDTLTSASLTASSALAEYPVTNITDQRLSTVWKTDATTTQSVVINLGSAKSITTLAVLGHNLASTTTITVQANSINDWAAPPVSEVLTWNKDVILKFIDAKTYQYWKFIFIGQGNLSIGRLWLSTYLTISPSSLIDFQVEYLNSDIVIYGLERQKFAKNGLVWRKISLSFPPTDNAMITSLLDWYDRVGLFTSVIFCNFDTIRGYPLVEPCYCSLSEGLKFSHAENMKFGYSLVFEEDK